MMHNKDKSYTIYKAIFIIWYD